ncbi:hypothetical protein [Mesorhizobium sp. M0435]
MDIGSAGVTIARQPVDHRLDHVRLAYSASTMPMETDIRSLPE